MYSILNMNVLKIIAYCRVVDRYRAHGRVDPPRARMARRVVDGPLREVVNASLQENGIQSVRGLARRLRKFFNFEINVEPIK